MTSFPFSKSKNFKHSDDAILNGAINIGSLENLQFATIRHIGWWLFLCARVVNDVSIRRSHLCPVPKWFSGSSWFLEREATLDQCYKVLQQLNFLLGNSADYQPKSQHPSHPWQRQRYKKQHNTNNYLSLMTTTITSTATITTTFYHY